MMLSSLPTAIAKTSASQAFATCSFVCGPWHRASMTTCGSHFGLSGSDTSTTGKRPYRLSNTSIA